ncbi:NAD-dependent epimerase/dehydratase family protein [Flammeovirga sp. EKP202]|uniref:NAD-dependent epimerase/dehydratase family protein n=1 Tax=Flammeovirga sp. EKP202 TaxID=2770592 RepID=UPI00165FDD24|nr:NAD-dependent epimerase/dehydratase family protein [Flammeovirga sp. EKP202]MBD0403124.1 NAD-dependent epimerase/dehydratase family protein [Flammeovirga sp. EKP202]
MALLGKKVFVTGGTGFVGGYIIQALLKEGAQVVAMNGIQNDKSFLKNESDQIEWVDVHLLDPGKLSEVLQEVEYIVHAASIVSFNTSREELRAINVDGTANLVNIALQSNIKKFVFISSIAALGIPEFGDQINEESKWTGEKGMSQYAISKYNAEQEVWRGFREGLDMVILNPSVIFGVGDFKRSSLSILNYIKKGVKFYPSGLFSSVDVRDVSQGVVNVLNLPITGERFILNADNLPFREALSIISKQLNVNPPVKSISRSTVLFVYYIKKILSIFSSKQNALTKDLINTLFSSYQYQNTKAVEKLNINFHSLEETMLWINSKQ